MRDETATAALPSNRGLEEQRLDRVRGQTEKSEWNIRRVHQNPQLERVTGEQLRYERPVARNVGLGEETVRRTHGTLPECDQRCAVCRSGTTNVVRSHSLHRRLNRARGLAPCTRRNREPRQIRRGPVRPKAQFLGGLVEAVHPDGWKAE